MTSSAQGQNQPPFGELPRTIYHYTDFAGFAGILESKSLWATELRFTNDRSELKHGVTWAIDHLDRQPTDEVREEVKRWLKSLDLDAVAVFSVSFSTERNLLSQWRMYTKDCHGVSIGFDVPSLMRNLGDSFRLVRCVYSQDEQRAIAGNSVDELVLKVRTLLAENLQPHEFKLRLHDLRSMFATQIARLKDDAFQQECEYRIVGSRKWNDASDVRFRATPRALIPYLVFPISPAKDIPTDAIVEVTIGPDDDGGRLTYSANLLLAKNASIQSGMTIYRGAAPIKVA